MNTSIKVILYKSKLLSNGEHPILLRVIKDRKSKYISVGFSCHPDLWDDEDNFPKKKHPHFKSIKLLIARKKLEAEKIVYDLENEDENLSVFEIKNKLKKEKVNNSDVITYFDSIISRLVTSGQISNAQIYKGTKANLKSFTGNKTLNFSEIDILFLNKYEEFLLEKKVSINTISIHLRTLRALINKAIKENVCSAKYYSFKNFNMNRYGNVKTPKRAISRTDIEKIKGLDLSGQPKLIDAKNIFLFSFFCRGINFIDMALLQWKNIKNNQLTYIRKKTKEHFTLELLLPAREILDYYKTITCLKNESYIFPILNENHHSQQTIFNRKRKILRAINKDLKEIARIAEIDAHLTTYVARHSFATIMKKSGISTTIISQALGHDSEKTTQIYLESFENSILDEASKALL